MYKLHILLCLITITAAKNLHQFKSGESDETTSDEMDSLNVDTSKSDEESSESAENFNDEIATSEQGNVQLNVSNHGAKIRQHFINESEYELSVNGHPRSDQTSLVFVFDGTKSMENTLIQFRSGVESILKKIRSQNDSFIYNYIFVPFRDPTAAPIVEFDKKEMLVTTNPNKLIAALNEFSTYGGGDCPDSILSGIISALELALPKSFVYIFTDAVPNDVEIFNLVVEQIHKKQAMVTRRKRKARLILFQSF